MIARRKDYSKKLPSKDARKIYILCEGKCTEPEYFRFFEGLSSNLKVIPIPPKDGETDPLKLIELAKETFFGENYKYLLDYMDHDMVWFAIDTDTWMKEGKITKLRDFCREQNEKIMFDYDEVKPYSAWNVAQSNPCFEIWLYYHHYDEKPEISEVEEFVTMKDFVHHKISGGFNYQRDPVKIHDAVLHSKNNFLHDKNNNPLLFSTEQYLLGSEILKFVNAEIQKLRNKF